jgi:hypothetical protein
MGKEMSYIGRRDPRFVTVLRGGTIWEHFALVKAAFEKKH